MVGLSIAAFGPFSVGTGQAQPPPRFQTFSAVDLPDTVVTTSAPWVRDVPPDVRRNDDLADRRIVTIVMDDALEMKVIPNGPDEIPCTGQLPDTLVDRDRPAPIQRARELADMLVDRLGPRDLAAVVFPMSQDAGQDFTTDVDMTLMKVVKKLPTEAKPDGSTYAAPFHKLYVTDERGAIAVFQMDDADHYRKLEGFPVEKRVHTLAIDQATSRVYAPEQEEAGKPVARMVVYDAVVKR